MDLLKSSMSKYQSQRVLARSPNSVLSGASPRNKKVSKCSQKNSPTSTPLVSSTATPQLARCFHPEAVTSRVSPHLTSLSLSQSNPLSTCLKINKSSLTVELRSKRAPYQKFPVAPAKPPRRGSLRRKTDLTQSQLLSSTAHRHPLLAASWSYLASSRFNKNHLSLQRDCHQPNRSQRSAR